MSAFARSDPSLLSRWWWTVDRWLLLALFLLAGVGFLLTFAASTPVAERLGLPSFHFAERQLAFLILALAVMFAISLMQKKTVRRLGSLLFPVMLALLYLTLFAGPEIKGATRWLPVGSFTFQPSEFLKPTFIVFAAWMLGEGMHNPAFPGRRIALAAFALAILGLALQPDFGQAALLSLVFGAQLGIAGLPLAWIGVL
ncbi:MAG TPA: FtsW/RodA/SpoVE family cell cycle protein, partial [Sphingomonadales bacterium]|nr:FtsW/RodA/SpoVE family cell cycle protein [Sphingomonadales bacterium]